MIPYKMIAVSPNHLRLLKYIVAYRRLRGKASMKLVAEQLLLAYAKQLTSGMPEQAWRDNILMLVNMCEEEQAQYDKVQYRRQREFHKKADQFDKKDLIVL